MRPWGEHLAAEGFAVAVPAAARPRHHLAGLQHHTPCTDWYGEVDAPSTSWPPTATAWSSRGLSMGGTLALRLAERRPDDVAGLVLVNPALLTERLDAKLLPLLAQAHAQLGADRQRHQEARRRRSWPTRSCRTRAMMSLRRLWAETRADLATVTAPLLVFRSREDHVVEPASVAAAAGRVVQPDVTEVVLEDSYHVATLDNDAPRIFARVGRLDPRALPAPPRAPSRDVPLPDRRDRAAAGPRAGATTAWTPPLWSPLRDVDPRVGEHLLDLLRDAGIAAYLEPSADVSPYTRTVYLPSPPSDRLFVDRARAGEARGLVERQRRRARPAAPRRCAEQLRADLDEDAEWRAHRRGPRGRAARPVEAGDAGRAGREPSRPSRRPPVATAAAVPVEPDPLEAEEHFEPPPPPPLHGAGAGLAATPSCSSRPGRCWSSPRR